MTERCPYCSFDPTSMNDYCAKHRPEPAPTVEPAPCVWREDERGDYNTDCGKFGAWTVGGTYCHFCGKPLKITRLKGERA